MERLILGYTILQLKTHLNSLTESSIHKYIMDFLKDLKGYFPQQWKTLLKWFL